MRSNKDLEAAFVAFRLKGLVIEKKILYIINNKLQITLYSISKSSPYPTDYDATMHLIVKETNEGKMLALIRSDVSLKGKHLEHPTNKYPISVYKLKEFNGW